MFEQHFLVASFNSTFKKCLLVVLYPGIHAIFDVVAVFCMLGTQSGQSQRRSLTVGAEKHNFFTHCKVLHQRMLNIQKDIIQCLVRYSQAAIDSSCFLYLILVTQVNE